MQYRRSETESTNLSMLVEGLTNGAQCTCVDCVRDVPSMYTHVCFDLVRVSVALSSPPRA